MFIITGANSCTECGTCGASQISTVQSVPTPVVPKPMFHAGEYVYIHGTYKGYITDTPVISGTNSNVYRYIVRVVNANGDYNSNYWDETELFPTIDSVLLKSVTINLTTSTDSLSKTCSQQIAAINAQTQVIAEQNKLLTKFIEQKK